MFDIFYTGATAPNLFPYEKPAVDLADAKQQSRTEFLWLVDGSKDMRDFDFDWTPVPWEAHHTHIFPQRSQFEEFDIVFAPAANIPQIDHYHSRKFLPRKTRAENWVVLKHEAEWQVDPLWAPNPYEEPYIYVFGNQWYTAIEMPTVEYRVPGATEYKYVDEVVAVTQLNPANWHVLKHEAKWRIDPLWAPNPFEPPYVYVFGNQWYTAIEMPTLEYRVPGATEYKYVDDVIATTSVDKKNWNILKHEAEWEVDPQWAPNPFEPPYIYVFGNQWYSAIEMPTLEYAVPGATEYKYVDDIVAKATVDKTLFTVLFRGTDISQLAEWAPNPFEPPYIYVFGNQWYPASEMPTVEYTVPGATERKYVDDVVAMLPQNRTNWTVPEEVNPAQVDFSWVPHPKEEEPYIYHFGSEFQVSTGLLYTVLDAETIKFVESIPLLDTTAIKKATKTVDMFFVDMNNKMSATRFALLQSRYPNIQKIRYMNGWIETIKRCVTRSETQKFWVISSENVYDDFNFEWHAQPWQTFMTHIFASQWQKWSDTFLINKSAFTQYSKWAKTIEEFPNLNFVKDQPVYRPDDVYDIYFVDHLNTGSTAVLDKMKKRYPDVKVARFADSYLATLRRVMTTATTDYIWVTNSICDYSKFDFTWQPEPWQAKMLHVFQSDEQKFGDTFYIHVPTFKEQMDTIELLDWFTTVNYCTDQIVPRLPMDEVVYTSDSLVDAVKAHDFNGPFTIFRHHSIANTAKFSPSVWRKKDRVLHTFSQSGSLTVVPRDAKQFIDTQMYDYPYILPHKEQFIRDSALDIVYISNGEPDAERWYKHLVQFVQGRKIHWINGINGRDKAIKAAANASNTPWFYAVFAKLEVNPEFNWDWQPDYLQEPKHYIFHAYNPVTGLEYGHMATVAYNKQLVLDTNEYGLDFTMSKMNEVVPIMSGTAHYNVTPLVTWRTAFRECIKLLSATDDVSAKRLLQWSTIAKGKNAEWSIKGAQDAAEYYEQVKGAMPELMKSFSWQWLDAYFEGKYVPTQHNVQVHCLATTVEHTLV
jgi:hypothetical protein